MTRIDDTKCPTCAHYRLIEPYAPTPICGKTKLQPIACVLVWDRCGGTHWEARK